MNKLARLEKVDLRNQWKDEAKDFTPWLAEPENIEILSEAIGMDLEVIGSDKLSPIALVLKHLLLSGFPLRSGKSIVLQLTGSMQSRVTIISSLQSRYSYSGLEIAR